MVRVFSQKLSSTIVGNVDIYSVGIESVYHIVQTGRIECFAGVLRVFHGKALPARYSRNTAISICPDFSHSNHVQGTCIISRDA